jgi:predicted SAM-dependent methyltransferase
MSQRARMSETTLSPRRSMVAGRARHFLARFVRGLVRRRSTKRQLAMAMQISSGLVRGLIRQTLSGGKLRTYCRGNATLFLNIGCGDHIEAGWTNIDLVPRQGAFFHDLLDPLPIADQSVSYIHAEHVIEHLEFSDAVVFLRDCHRVLKRGGVLRIIVPDSEKYIDAYAKNDSLFFERLNRLGGAVEPLPTKGAICNQMFHMGGHHRFGWDFETLEYVVRQIGFLRIVRSCQNDKTLERCIDGDDWWRPVESLYAIVTR